MKTMKVSDLSNTELNWAVAEAIGAEKIECDHDEEVLSVDVGHTMYCNWEVSSDWDQCGPLVDRYRIDFDCFGLEVYARPCVAVNGSPVEAEQGQYGNTHTEAACRAIVAAHFGESVSVPGILW